MAKYKINHCCGHGSLIKDLVGPIKERERKIEWMECCMLCPDCYKAKKKADKAAEPRTAQIVLPPATISRLVHKNLNQKQKP